MGFTEAFLIGALVGGLGGAVAYVAFASTARGRSVARFTLTRWNAGQALSVAYGYFAQQGMTVQPIPDGIVARTGSEWVAGARVIEVRARDTPGGCQVAVDAYLRSLYPKEVTLDPTKFFGMVPRRRALQVAQGLLSAYGVPQVPFVHQRA